MYILQRCNKGSCNTLYVRKIYSLMIGSDWEKWSTGNSFYRVVYVQKVYR